MNQQRNEITRQTVNNHLSLCYSRILTSPDAVGERYVWPDTTCGHTFILPLGVDRTKPVNPHHCMLLPPKDACDILLFLLQQHHQVARGPGILVPCIASFLHRSIQHICPTDHVLGPMPTRTPCNCVICQRITSPLANTRGLVIPYLEVFTTTTLHSKTLRTPPRIVLEVLGECLNQVIDHDFNHGRAFRDIPTSFVLRIEDVDNYIPPHPFHWTDDYSADSCPPLPMKPAVYIAYILEDMMDGHLCPEFISLRTHWNPFGAAPVDKRCLYAEYATLCNPPYVPASPHEESIYSLHGHNIPAADRFFITELAKSAHGDTSFPVPQWWFAHVAHRKNTPKVILFDSVEIQTNPKAFREVHAFLTDPSRNSSHVFEWEITEDHITAVTTVPPTIANGTETPEDYWRGKFWYNMEGTIPIEEMDEDHDDLNHDTDDETVR